jgi:hypothetical protein
LTLSKAPTNISRVMKSILINYKTSFWIAKKPRWISKKLTTSSKTWWVTSKKMKMWIVCSMIWWLTSRKTSRKKYNRKSKSMSMFPNRTKPRSKKKMTLPRCLPTWTEKHRYWNQNLSVISISVCL